VVDTYGIIAKSNTSALKVGNDAMTDFFRTLIVPTLLEIHGITITDWVVR
jgi:hypothetical protein